MMMNVYSQQQGHYVQQNMNKMSAAEQFMYYQEMPYVHQHNYSVDHTQETCFQQPQHYYPAEQAQGYAHMQQYPVQQPLFEDVQCVAKVAPPQVQTTHEQNNGSITVDLSKFPEKEQQDIQTKYAQLQQIRAVVNNPQALQQFSQMQILCLNLHQKSLERDLEETLELDDPTVHHWSTICHRDGCEPLDTYDNLHLDEPSSDCELEDSPRNEFWGFNAGLTPSPVHHEKCSSTRSTDSTASSFYFGSETPCSPVSSSGTPRSSVSSCMTPRCDTPRSCSGSPTGMSSFSSFPAVPVKATRPRATLLGILSEQVEEQH